MLTLVIVPGRRKLASVIRWESHGSQSTGPQSIGSHLVSFHNSYNCYLRLLGQKMMRQENQQGPTTPEEASPGKTDQNNYLDPEASNQFIVADQFVKGSPRERAGTFSEKQQFMGPDDYMTEEEKLNDEFGHSLSKKNTSN